MMDATFGKMQAQMSSRMRRYPLISRWVSKIFGYTLVGNYARALTFRSLLEKLPTEKFEQVLDLGCGYGEYSFMMADALPDAQITALDINPAPIEKIREVISDNNIMNLQTHLGMIESLPVGDNYYDFIFSIDVFEHIREDEMPFRQAYEKLKPGGFLLVKIPSKEQLTILPENWFEDHHDWLEDEHIGQVYELEDLKERMAKEGFEPVFATYGDGWLSRFAWEIGYLSHKAGPVFQLACLPFAKAIVRLGRVLDSKKRGNTIQVIGKKVI